jgi:AcrR family transcriptional regulator
MAQRAQTREALIDAAIARFTEAGYSNVSVDAVAAAAGYTSGAVYDHFGNKEGLLVAIVERFLAEPMVPWTSVTSPARSFKDQLRAYGRAMSARDFTLHEDALVHELNACILRNEELRTRVGELIEHELRKLGDGIPMSGRFTGTDVIVIGQALLDGLKLRAAINPSLVRPELYEEAFALLAGFADLAEVASGQKQPADPE